MRILHYNFTLQYCLNINQKSNKIKYLSVMMKQFLKTKRFHFIGFLGCKTTLSRKEDNAELTVRRVETNLSPFSLKF
jgi:hypothetical protein